MRLSDRAGFLILSIWLIATAAIYFLDLKLGWWLLFGLILSDVLALIFITYLVIRRVKEG